MAKKVILPACIDTIVVEGVRFIRRIGSQVELFRLADKESHQVCIVLEIYGTRLFTSFENDQEFLNFYLKFKG